MAKRVRDYLEVSIDEQLDWPNSDAAFASWREVLERHGVAIFKGNWLPDGGFYGAGPCSDRRVQQ